MRTARRVHSAYACLTVLFASACIKAGGAGSNDPRHPPNYDTVTVTRSEEMLHIAVSTGEACPDKYERPPCFNVPAANVEVFLRASGEPQLLGTTSTGGELAVPLSNLDDLFDGQSIAESARAQLLVHGRVAAELPLGEIANRRRVIDITIDEADAVLADPSPDRDYVQLLLGRLLDMQMRGLADPRIADRTSRLYESLHDKNTAISAPGRLLQHVKDLLARFRSGGSDGSVPDHVQQDIEQTGNGQTVEPHSFSWALSVLPTMCKITVKGGELAAGELVETGAPGIALAIIAAAVGDDLSDWLVKSCCQMTTKSLGDASAKSCDGKSS